MNRDQLGKRHADAVRRWAPTMRDTGKVPPELLADLAGIADEYAREHAERVIARRELREEAATPPLVAADLEAPPVIRLPLDTVPEGTTPDRPSARTRTRGGPK